MRVAMLLRSCGRLFVVDPARALARNKVRSGLAMLGITCAVDLLALLFAGTFGVCFGMYPAIRASRMDPIAALRVE
jgi:ABC-type lipoprotein release transport system permease subunit